MNESLDLASTAALLERIRSGDDAAREALADLYRPLLRRWASGRLPERGRSMADTEDLVQESLLEGIQRVDDFEARREGAFLAYLRQILVNKLRAELRRPRSRTHHDAEDVLDGPSGRSVLPEAMDRETVLDYDRSLAALKPPAREAIILRFEFGLSFGEMAAAMGKSSADAARMSVNRALGQLAIGMKRSRGGD